jgi:uncharacterized protein with PIN domain
MIKSRPARSQATMSGTLTFRFHAELNDLLPRDRRETEFEHTFRNPASIKDVIESLGIPHTEVDLILVDGTPVIFDHTTQDGESVDVYPVHSAPDLYPDRRLQRSPSAFRFVLDTHLGRLAAYLRMLGFDSLYRNDFRDAELAQVSASEERILLTRDKGLLMRGQVVYGHFVRARLPHEQLLEILTRYELVDRQLPFSRCMHCNGVIEPVAKEEIVERLMPRTREHYEEFRRCRDCGRIYWKGSHYRRMKQLISHISGSDPR